MTTLSNLKINDTVIVESINSKNTNFVKILQNAGLYKNKTLKVLYFAPLKSYIACSINNRVSAIPKELSKLVIVKKV